MSGEFVGKICPFCKGEIKEDDIIVKCSKCDMPHHRDCWVENQGCTTFGCDGTIQSADAAVPAQDFDIDVADNGQAAPEIFCTRCGTAIPAGDAFCTRCGTPVAPAQPAPAPVPAQAYYQQPQVQTPPPAAAPAQAYYQQPQMQAPPPAAVPAQAYYQQPQMQTPPPAAAPTQPYYQQPQQGANPYYQQPQQGAQYGYNAGYPGGPQADAYDIANNKYISILCYFGIFLLIPLLTKPESKFVKFHANQGLICFIAGIILGILSIIPVIGILAGLVSIGLLVLEIMGIVNCCKGEMNELPLIGKFRLIK